MSAEAADLTLEHKKQENRVRFETELEFVQCLANPYYLQSLAQQGHFEDEAFLNYLNYLKYFTDPRYARFLTYPSALNHLALLTSPEGGPGFRRALKEQNLLAMDIAGKELRYWAGWREPLLSRPDEQAAPGDRAVNGDEKDSTTMA